MQFAHKYIVVWPWSYSLSCDEVKDNEAVRSSSSSEFNAINFNPLKTFSNANTNCVPSLCIITSQVRYGHLVNLAS